MTEELRKDPAFDKGYELGKKHGLEVALERLAALRELSNDVQKNCIDVAVHLLANGDQALLAYFLAAKRATESGGVPRE